MSTEIEAAGALIDAGLVAHEIEKLPGGGHTGAHGTTQDTAHGSTCRNCGAALQGRFCHACGQAAHIHRSLLHLGEELLHGLLHFDGKSWRTLPMLVAKPGQLTRRYIEGQRARYVSPLALFLFMVFLMFFAASLTSAPSDIFGDSKAIVDVRIDLEKDLDKARAEVAKAQAQLDQAQAGKGDVDTAKEALDDAKSELVAAQTAASAVLSATSAATSAAANTAANTAAAKVASAAASTTTAPHAASGAPAGAATPDSHRVPAWAQVLRESPFKSGHPDLDTAVRNAADNPELTIYKLKNTAYKFSFMLVPISLPFLWLMFFWRRGIAMYDHAVFVLYSLSFMSLLFVVLTGLAALHAGKLIPVVATFAPPIHMAAQLHGAYRLGFWGTLWRTIALLIVSAIVFAMFLLFIVYLTMR